MWFFRACACLIGGALLAVALTAMRCMHNPYGCLLRDGEKVGQEFYLYSPSSQAVSCQSVAVSELYSLTGETAVFRFPSEELAKESVQTLLKTHRAKIVAEETVAGVRSLYAYSARLGRGVRLFGETVNLHIVLSGETVQAGVPIVFGGY